jgi:hypothetical protein
MPLSTIVRLSQRRLCQRRLCGVRLAFLDQEKRQKQSPEEESTVAERSHRRQLDVVICDGSAFRVKIDGSLSRGEIPVRRSDFWSDDHRDLKLEPHNFLVTMAGSSGLVP